MGLRPALRPSGCVEEGEMDKPWRWWSSRRKREWEAARPAIRSCDFPLAAPQAPEAFAAVMARVVPGMTTDYLRRMEEVMLRPPGPHGLGLLQLTAIQMELVRRGVSLRRLPDRAR